MINLGTIDTLLDTDPARGATDTIKRQTSAKTKTFTRIRFSPDGNLLLAGGESNTFCMYSVPERLVLKRWRIIQNRSLDGVVLDLNRRNFTEFGNMNLIDTSDEEDDEPDNKMAIKLPGTKNFDLTERRSRPEVNIYEVTYCPTGRRFAVCSTEGVAVYTLDNISIFDQFQLDGQTNVHVIRGALSNKDFTTALMATLRLNITECISQCLKAISVKQIPLVIKKENKMKDAEKDEMKDEESKGSETNGKLNDENKNPNGMNSISIPNEMWQTADKEILDGDFDDDMLQFLGSFEEVLPEGLNPTEQQPKKEKQEKKKPKKTEEPPSEDIEERRLAKKQRRREQMAANRKLKKERLARRKQREAQKTEEETVEQVSTKKEKAKKRRGEKTEISTKSKKSKKKVGISAWKQFYFLPNEILQAIEQMGFTQPTEIQSAVLPIAVRNRQDVLGAAETGSGKTLAFGIPLVARLLEEPIEEKATGPRALIIAPTRELVIQIMRHINDLIATTSLKATSILGRLAQVKQERVITQQRPDIVVATPGRLWAMMKESEEGDYLAEWKQLKCLVVDETDRMVEEGYFAELTEILNKIHEESDKEKLQTLVFSATLTFTKAQDVAEEEKKKAKELSSRQKIQRLIKLTGLRENKHKVIDLTQMGTAGCLVEARINCANLFEKDTALVYLLTRYPGRTIVFVNSVDAARRLHCILKSIGIDPMILHAKMVQKQRLRNLEHFSESKNAVLIATNVASRGLDIQGIDHVIHYQVPKKVEIYIHGIDTMVKKTRQLQSQLRSELSNSLPQPDGSDSIRTKYITPEIIARLRSNGDNAIDVLNKKIEETKEWKRKSRKAAQSDETNTTLDIDCKFNIENLSVSASGFYLLDTDERGDIHFVQLISEVKTFTFRSNDTIGSVKWAPDAVRIAVCRETDLQIHDAGIWYRNKSYNPFSLTRTYKLSSDQLKSVDWSDDSELIVAGGDNKIVRVVGSKDFKNIFIHPLASHKGNIVTCQFMKDSYGMISVCKRGLPNVWTCNLRPGELEEGVWQKDDEDTTDVEMDDTQKIEKIFFKKSEKYWLTESSGAGKSVDVAASQYHKETKILATTFNNGVTVLHEIPTFALIHNLKVMDSRIQTVEWNRSCDWLAIGCGKGSTSQLVVWEWQSESYVMKQQGHSLRITSAEYSPDGAMIATGAEDGKVKIWDSRSSICTVTFDEHASGVTAVKWTQSGKAILSSSLDGTIRARDRKRYRNFRTFVCLEPTQLATLAVDKSGDLVLQEQKSIQCRS
uniref:RNA helicase n=1 Tax=Caenorhabditis tropicalis TaxID=1561998 RepID=A0A1I7U5U6_9PELO